MHSRSRSGLPLTIGYLANIKKEKGESANTADPSSYKTQAVRRLPRWPANQREMRYLAEGGGGASASSWRRRSYPSEDSARLAFSRLRFCVKGFYFAQPLAAFPHISNFSSDQPIIRRGDFATRLCAGDVVLGFIERARTGYLSARTVAGGRVDWGWASAMRPWCAPGPWKRLLTPHIVARLTILGGRKFR